jgi:hypothetical protein
MGTIRQKITELHLISVLTLADSVNIFSEQAGSIL